LYKFLCVGFGYFAKNAGCMDERVCFVLMGYGTKTDFATGRPLDLDKSYENIIKPVFDELNIRCFRASDVKHSGTIDVPMYKYIHKADIVVADISTLNANAIYELGVRHALRPQTTIVIAEDKMEYPFDLKHTKILSYRHLGEDIGVTEAKRFKKELKELVESIMVNPQVDSPIYTYLPNLRPPSFTEEEIQQLEEASEDADTISNLLSRATKEISELRFDAAKQILSTVLQLAPNDPFVRQQLALATYKSQSVDKIEALNQAEEILRPLNPDQTHDTETLGLLGAIYKRRYLLTNDVRYLELAIEFYGRGFVLVKDYYNGINLSLLLLKQSLTREEKTDAIADIVLAKRVRSRTENYCNDLLNQEDFKEKPDRVWVLLTLAEVKFAEGKKEEMERLLAYTEQLAAGKFERASFDEQMEILSQTLGKVKALLDSFSL
jgi:tetratricopeptide (TPR) repeat protein